MKVLVIGPGAIGGLIAGFLSRRHGDIAIMARGETYEAISRDGITIEHGEEIISTRPTAVLGIEDAPAPDIAIVAVKFYSLEALVPTIRELSRNGSLILFAMNGVPGWLLAEGDDRPSHRLFADIPRDGMAWASVYAGASAVAPGRIVNASAGRNRVVFGRADNRPDARLEWLAGQLSGSGLPTQTTVDILGEAWFKLCSVVSMSSVAAMTGMTNLEICEHPELGMLARTIVAETAAIGDRLGIALSADPLTRLDPKVQSRHKPSLLQDIEAGRPIEIDNTILALRDLSRRTGVPAPTLVTFAALIETNFGKAKRI